MMIKRYILFCIVVASLLSQSCLSLPSLKRNLKHVLSFFKMQKKKDDWVLHVSPTHQNKEDKKDSWKRYCDLMDHKKPVELDLLFSHDNDDAIVQDSFGQEKELYENNEVPSDLEKECNLRQITRFEKSGAYEIQEIAKDIFGKEMDVQCFCNDVGSICVCIQNEAIHDSLYEKKRQKFIEQCKTYGPAEGIKSVRIWFDGKKSGKFFSEEVLISGNDPNGR